MTQELFVQATIAVGMFVGGWWLVNASDHLKLFAHIRNLNKGNLTTLGCGGACVMVAGMFVMGMGQSLLIIVWTHIYRSLPVGPGIPWR